MTSEELESLRGYSDRIIAAGGDISVLSREERQEMRILLSRWLDENEVFATKR